MGRGISLLLLQEAALLRAQKKTPVLHLIDTQEDPRDYLRAHLTRFAEKSINQLRRLYAENPNLVSNEAMIRTFVQEGMDCVRFATDWHAAKNAQAIFEAIVEDVEAKTELFSSLKAICSPETVYLSNTSSIPISTLNEKSGLGGKIVGFHFYNPAHVQKLIELVFPEGVDPALPPFAKEVAKELHKTVVESADVPGFIGTGFLIRELQMALELAKTHGKERINRMTREELLRPMGIFELVDFIGQDVCERIADVMNLSLEFDVKQQGKEDPTLAKRYLEKCRAIGQQLIDAHVAKSAEDIETVLTLGFHHPYGLMRDMP